MIVPATDSNFLKARELLEAGQVVAFPTETVYGLGANAFDQSAVAKIFAAKNRPYLNPLIVHIGNASEVEKVALIERGSLCQKRLNRLSALWPGPLSLVLPKQPCIPDNVTAGLTTVAVRVPNHPIAQKLLKLISFPLAAPSANTSTEVSPTCAKHVLQSLGERVSLIIDGGDCAVGLESTVLSITGPTPTLLRPGAITREEIENILQEHVHGTEKVELHTPGAAPPSPGLLFKHYAPKTPIAIIDPTNSNKISGKIGLISFKALSNDKKTEYTETILLSKDENLEEIAKKLFAAIRELDQHKLDLILIDTCQETGLGTAIMDRIRRACGV